MIVARGLRMVDAPHLLLIRMTAQLDERGFTRYCEEWMRSVDARTPDSSVVAVYDIPSWPGLSAAQRKTWAAMLQSRKDVLQQTTAGMVLVSPSPLVRGALTAIFWFAPPPYPHRVGADLERAFAWACEREAGLRQAECLALHGELLRDPAEASSV